MNTDRTHITAAKHLLDNVPRPTLRLGEIDRLIRKYRIIVPPPSRPKLIELCNSGIFETAGSGPTSIGWLVYEDSFLKWVDTLRTP